MSGDEQDVVGYVDAFDDGMLFGWAARRNSSERVTLAVSSAGRVVGTTCARLFREDLVKAEIGDGRHAFAFRVPDAIRQAGAYVLEVREETSGTELRGSPFAVHEDPDRPLRGGASQVRRFLATQYCAGEGIEIGALHHPMQMPEGVRVQYADAFTTEELKRLWSPEVDEQHVVPTDILTDATTLHGVADESFDFAVASHVVEHLEDPLQCLFALLRVVRPGGCVFLAIPDRRHTFDVRRPGTTIAHVMRDYCGGPAWSRRAHYDEWVRLVEGLEGERAASRAAALEQSAYPIHFHAWDPDEFTALLREARVMSPRRFEIDLFMARPPEALWILRRA